MYWWKSHNVNRDSDESERPTDDQLGGDTKAAGTNGRALSAGCKPEE